MLFIGSGMVEGPSSVTLDEPGGIMMPATQLQRPSDALFLPLLRLAVPEICHGAMPG